jgi:outer membrane protein insertion porin family/translocation and assembly module TamA
VTPRGASRLGAALLAAAALAGGRAEAQEVNLTPLAEPIQEVPEGTRVAAFDIEGAQAISPSRVKRRLYTEASSSLPFFGKTRRLDRDEFLNDLRRVVVFYQQNGYFDADVLGYRAVRGDDGVELAIVVEEGEPSTIDSLSMEIVEEPADTLPPAADTTPLPAEEELLSQLRIREGDVFSEARIDSSRARVTAYLQNHGYAFAEVLLEYRIRKEERSAAVGFTAYPGDRWRFGQVTVEGETDVSRKLILGQVQFDPGQPYRLDRVQETQRRLYQLNLFRRVQVDPQYEDPVGDSLPVVIRLADAEEHLVRLGAGYGSEELLRASASWLDRNFLGGARQARLAAEYSRLRRGASASLTQPNVLIDDLSATAAVFLQQEVEDTYTLRRAGTTGRINHEVSGDVRTFYGFNVERDTFTEIDSVQVVEALLGQGFLNPSTLSFAELGVLVDTSDDLFTPTRGNTANLSYHLSAGLLGDYRYHRVTLLVTHYQQVRPGWVVAFKLLPGVLKTFGTDDVVNGDTVSSVPLFERLFAGGSTSVRGYRRRELGPLDVNGNPVGGEALFETSAELRYPLFGNFRGVAFVDAGNVWRDTSEVELADLRYTPGLGVRYDTPIGPIRVDAGFKTRAEDPGPSVVFHLSVGNAF